MDWRPQAAPETLRARAVMLERTRAFFHARGVLEVDTPVLQGGANFDPGNHSLAVSCGSQQRFLPTSPEHPLKRLVAAGYGAVWTLAPAFRMLERSARHQPEFRMLEWYRPRWDDRQLLTEVLALLQALTGWSEPCEIITYRQAFRQWAGIDPSTCSSSALAQALGDEWEICQGSREVACDLLLASRIEPHLGMGRCTALVDYPPHLAAQAQLRRDDDGIEVAARFELYRQGIELANGYHELTDARELTARLSTLERTCDDATLSRDQRFEAAIASGFPPCAGVAVGFDRVLMLSLNLRDIAQTMAFPWDLA
jgi:lysyl-tRNA synthetase class 2